jgi:hypothetical protein
MSAKIVKLSRPAEPNIHRVFEEFLDTQRTRLAPRTLARYADVLDLLRSYLNGHGHESLSATETSAAAARDLPRAERAAQILRDAADGLNIAVTQLAEEDYLEFNHFTIAKVEPGRLWLEVREKRKMCERGPIPAPEKATRWLRPGWTISCSLGRVRKSWRLLEVANVYPA